jgi:hypothetical protein
VLFTQIYEGPMTPNAKAPEVHRIREQLHAQLRELWTYAPLSEARGPDGFFGDVDPTLEVAGQHYLPIVHEVLRLRAELNVIMLRPDVPGRIVRQGGDVDNHLKTLFDALSAPSQAGQVQPSELGTSPEDPIHVLLQDDSLITKVTVETDRHLAPPNNRELRILVQVITRATSLRYNNLPLVSG